MKPIEGWNDAQAIYGNGNTRLPIGNYILTIINAEVYDNPRNGKQSLKIMFDVAEGEFAEYFTKKFERNYKFNSKAEWNPSGIFYISLKPEQVGRFKGFITCIEKSNSGYKWNWEETSLMGKRFAGQLCGEPYNGKFYAKLNAYYPVDEFDDIPEAFNKDDKEQQPDNPFADTPSTPADNLPHNTQWGNAFGRPADEPIPF